MRLAPTVSILSLLVMAPLAAHAEDPGPRSVERSQVPPALSLPSAPVGSSVGADGQPLAGYRGGLFYLRDANDNFRLYVTARAQIDMYNYFGPSVTDTTLKSTFALRRIRPELAGEFLGSFSFWVAGDFGSTAFDNPKGTTESYASAPGKAPTATSARFASAETPTYHAAPTDVWVNVRGGDLVNVQIGQYNPPFTMEGVMSEKVMPFMERSLGARTLAVPLTKDIGAQAWGITDDRLFYYALGVFNGDGQNRPNPDNRFDVMGRVVVHPLAQVVDDKVLKDVHIGASFRAGDRDPNYVDYDMAALTTQGNYGFWSPTYTSSKGYTHIIPAGRQLGFAGELRIPVSIVDLTSEVVYINDGTREALDGYVATNSERFGSFKGFSYYVTAGIWLFGPRDVTGLPGYNLPPHLDLSKADPPDPKTALQLLVRWEQLKVTYDSASRAGTADAKNVDGDIKTNVLSFAANYWATRHVRLTAQYDFNAYPGSAPTSPSSKTDPAQDASQRATAPANNLPYNNATPGAPQNVSRDTAHVLHEVLFRAAIAF
jgi:hypothetical protein